MSLRVLALAAYIAAVILANWLTSRFGLIPVGFGLVTTAGTYAAGAALLARDVLQDLTGRQTVLWAILVGGALSAAFAGPQLALASALAFLIAETCDTVIYTPLRRRGWARAVLASNVAGAFLDTIVFLWLAGFPIWTAIPGQMIGKFVWASLIPVVAVVVVRRVVSRQPVHAEGA